MEFQYTLPAATNPLSLRTCHREHPVNWENPTHALAQREPRRGCRAVLAATVHVPQGPLLVYNLHLEVRPGKGLLNGATCISTSSIALPSLRCCSQRPVRSLYQRVSCRWPKCNAQVFCGILARVAQFADVLRDSREQLGKVKC